MWLLRVLRHPVMIAFLGGHTLLVLLEVFLCWSAEATEWGLLDLASVVFGLFLLLLDLPVLWIVSWLTSEPIFGDFFSADDSFPWFALRVVVLGSIQWLIFGMLFAIPDLRDKPER
jgi:hypothetical protein